MRPTLVPNRVEHAFCHVCPTYSSLPRLKNGPIRQTKCARMHLWWSRCVHCTCASGCLTHQARSVRSCRKGRSGMLCFNLMPCNFPCTEAIMLLTRPYPIKWILQSGSRSPKGDLRFESCCGAVVTRRYNDLRVGTITVRFCEIGTREIGNILRFVSVLLQVPPRKIGTHLFGFCQPCQCALPLYTYIRLNVEFRPNLELASGNCES